MGKLVAVMVALVVPALAPAASALVPGMPASVAHAQPPGLTDALPPPRDSVSVPDGRDTHRILLGVGGAVFASFPMSIGDPGIALVVGTPLWLGNRYRFFQWAAEVNGVVGFGTDEKNAYVLVGPQIGPNFYFGSVFGFELRIGLDGVAQLGHRTVGGLALGGSGAYVFRFWDDDRKRIKLMMQMRSGGYFADDPGNDLGMNAGAFIGGLAYETPL
jgi:hypothetical protein